MPQKGQRHDVAARERISHGTKRGQRRSRILEARVAELERLLYRVSPSDLVAMRQAGALPDTTHPLVDLAAASVGRLRLAAEGEPGSPHHRPLSEQRIALLEVAQKVLLLGMLEMVRGLEGDSESSARAGTLLGKFAGLVKDCLGLDAPEHEVPDLASYLESKASESRASDANGDDPDESSAGVSRTAPSGDGGGTGVVLAPRAVANGRGAPLDDRQPRSTTPPERGVSALGDDSMDATDSGGNHVLQPAAGAVSAPSEED